MKDNKRRLFRIISYLYSAVAAAVIIYSIVTLIKPFPQNSFYDNDAIELSDSWQLSVDGGPSDTITLPQSLNVPLSNDVSISRTLPTFIKKGWSVSIYSSFQNISAYINGVRVLYYSGDFGMLSSDIPGTQILFIPMDPSYSGKTLTIHYSSPLPGRRGVLHKIYIGNRTAIIYRHLLDRIVIIIAGMLLVVIGIVIVAYKAFSGTKGYIGQALQYQGIYMLMLGLFFILQSGMNQLIFSDMNWAHFLEFYSIMLVPIAFIFGVDTVEKHFFEKEADISALICILIIAFELFQTLILHHDFLSILYLTYTAFAISSLFTIVSAVIIAFLDRALLKDMKWMIYAFLGIVISAFAEILLYYVAPSLEDCRCLACGVLIHFFCTLRWIQQQTDIIETEKIRSVQQAEAKSAFLANMSHEIRTPVNTIMGLDDMIIKKSRDPRTLSYAADMKQAGQNLLYIINNILEFSRIESGRTEVINAPYSLLPMLQKLHSEILRKRISPDISFSVNLQPDLPSSYIGDERKICRIISSMLDNSVRYTSEGSITLSVSGNSISDDTERLYFSVKDTGRGMTREALHKVFDSFNSRDNHESHGIGLGLAIAGSLAKSMGGIIEARSIRGTGSEFTLMLPQTVSGKTPAGLYCDPLPELKAASKNRSIRILLADDDRISRKIMISMLIASSDIDCVSDGFKALEKLSSNRYDIIFLDHIMPGMNGMETFRKIRETGIETPVVMLSAGTSSDTREKYQALGFADFILKPVDEKILKDTIYGILAASAGKEESGT